MFLVEPGVSFHAVSEVRGAKARVSIQGWLHAPSLEQTRGFEHRGLATLQQILSTSRSDEQSVAKPATILEAKPIAPEVGEAVLTSEDLEFLAQWLSPPY